MISVCRIATGMAANEVSVFLLLWLAMGENIGDWIIGRLTVGDLATSMSENTYTCISVQNSMDFRLQT